MSRASCSRGQSGFTLIEATISMTLLLIVLALSLTFLFGMQAFARRQQLFAEPRQTSRRAVDYISEIARSCTDMNYRAGNPNAIVIWYAVGHGLTPTQATMNNVTDPLLAEPGTDIITLGRATDARRIQFKDWNGHQNNANASAAEIYFADGCPDDILNMRMFMDATGCTSSSGTGCLGVSPSDGISAVLTAIDEQGNWAYFQISGYGPNNPGCADARPNFNININPGNAPGLLDINPPSDRGVTVPCSIAGGLQYYSFRVRVNPNTGLSELQQKTGIFNPNTDNPGTAFTPLLENVEDFQIAWIYEDGTVWNDAPGHQLPTTNQVPEQEGMGGPTHPVLNVRALRLSITSLAPRDIPNQTFAHYLRPASEDRAEATVRDRRYHYRLTSTVLLRNRFLGS